MIRKPRSLVALLGAALLVAACGGPSQPSGPAATGARSTDQPSNGASVAPTSEASEDGGSGGGGGTACDLLTVAEAAGVLGVASTGAVPVEGEPSYCTYRDPDGKAVLSTVYRQTGGQSLFVTFESAEDAIVVPGVGDKAVFSESWLGTLFVLKGDRMFNLAGGPTDDMELRQELMTQLGAVGAGRM